MINSALEPLNCTVFLILNWSLNIFAHSSSSNLYFLVQEIFLAGRSIVCLVDSCLVLHFLLFRYICIENGMIGFTSLCRMLARFKVFFQARIDLTRPEYCRN